MVLENIKDSLVSHWSLGEAAGENAVDSIGSNDLTPTNDPTSATGKIGNGKDFESTSSQHFEISEAAAEGLQWTDSESFTIAAWVKLSTDTTGIIVGKTALGENEYDFYYSSALSRFGCEMHDIDDVTTTAVNADNFGAPSTGVWYYVHFGFDHTTNTQFVGVNTTTRDTATNNNAMHNDTAPFTVGAFYGPGIGTYLDGVIDELTVWNRAITTTEVSELYNSGDGVNLLDHLTTIYKRERGAGFSLL